MQLADYNEAVCCSVLVNCTQQTTCYYSSFVSSQQEFTKTGKDNVLPLLTYPHFNSLICSNLNAAEPSELFVLSTLGLRPLCIRTSLSLSLSLSLSFFPVRAQIDLKGDTQFVTQNRKTHTDRYFAHTLSRLDASLIAIMQVLP